MNNLPLTEKESEIFISFLNSLKNITKKRLIEKGYNTFLPSFDVVYETAVEALNSIIEMSKEEPSLSALLNFSMDCSQKLTKNDDFDFNVHSMIVDVYRNLSGEI
ncbi:hypothetical protein PMZ65_10585 [Clostridium perfringens]|uniref:hypothetical protein n=1 Tax=Clostridium perfringens TaxID=1502 RepID=UPI0018A949A4|nr:hypothetical protein [Clostridium perfringens]MDB2069696.1 hypothetical protein [Clostridium perfringens]MDK0898084.1 hypothetical protein [Clostridium perfringens]MDM0903139.1 hypothetical protein [Clostridium perfringens]MDU1686067.1 hypothetical protein [Clostridium perfringens]MDU1809895.1 hypothetical protein [Clostridium perfringens]